MMTAESLSTISTLVNGAHTVCVFFPEKASHDVILSAVTFARGLRSLGINVTVSTPGLIAEKMKQFAGVDEVTHELGNKNLDVSFPYTEEHVDKVSYHIDEESQTFHLVVQPRKGAKPLDSSLVTYTLTGADADLIFTFGVDNLEDLGALYVGYEQLFEQTSIVSIHNYETSYGTVKLNITGSASYAEVVAYILQELAVEIDGETATNLLAAIESATNTFKSLTVTAQTFEIAGKLLAIGARRVRLHDESAKGNMTHTQANGESLSKKFIPVTPKDGFVSEKKKSSKSEHIPTNPSMRA